MKTQPNQGKLPPQQAGARRGTRTCLGESIPITSLLSKGQVIIPKPICTALNWRPGQKLKVIDTGDGILLKPVEPFSHTSLEEVAGCLKYSGPAKSLADMEDAIRKGVKETAERDLS